MGDLTLLPDGTVFLCNGAKLGELPGMQRVAGKRASPSWNRCHGGHKHMPPASRRLASNMSSGISPALAHACAFRCADLVSLSHQRLQGQHRTKPFPLLSGIAGGSGPNGAAATNGTTVAELYDPAAPAGSRWSTVADSGIYRLYHSWSLLKRDATASPLLPATLSATMQTGFRLFA